MLRAFKLALATATAVAALATSAHASAIYTWEPISGAGTGQLTISDSAYFAGHASFNYEPGMSITSDITSFSFNMFGQPFGSFQPHSGMAGEYAVNLNIVGDNLTGGVDTNNTSNEIRMSGNANLWTIAYFASDGPDEYSCTVGGQPGVYRGACAGQTGRWVLTSAPTPPSSNVPEPASALLLLGGLVPLFRRR
jgi:hypothetical protein